MKSFFSSLKEVYSRLSWLDTVCSAIVALGLLVALLGINGKVSSFLEFLAVVAGVYLVARFIGWWRSRLLWSLRNRLIVAYLFIALVPVVLTAVLALFSALILYRQFGGYILYQDLQRRVDMVAAGTDQIAAALESASFSMKEEAV